MQKLKSALIAMTVGIVLLTALDWAAAAATGRSMILGSWNQAGHTTTLKNTGHGPALSLRSSHGPALAVTNGKRVKNLNADKLDGMDARAFTRNRNRVYGWATSGHTGGFSQALPPQEPGSYLVSYQVELNGAAGDPGNPNIINCGVVQLGLNGTTQFTRGTIGASQLDSVGTPPTLTGVGPAILVAGDQLQLRCTMSRNAQTWSTPTLQPLVVNLLRTDGTDVLVAPLGRTAATLRRSTH